MDKAPAPANFYRAFGLTFRSEILLPELRAAATAAEPDVTIEVGAIPAPREPVESLGPYIRFNARLFLLDLPCARFAVSAGRRIVIERKAGASEASVRAFLLGSVMGALCHQRSLLPLHAGAVAVDGSAFAFVGTSGAGKSTLALQFHQHGFPLLCEDVCVVSACQQGEAAAWPGLVHFKLWRQSIEAVGKSVSGLNRVLDTMDKYRLPAHLLANDEAYPLKAIYVLAPQERGSPIISRLRGVEAMKALVSHTYKGQFIPPVHRATHLAACAQVLRSACVFKVTRKWGLDFVATQARCLEEHFLELVQSSGFDNALADGY